MSEATREAKAEAAAAKAEFDALREAAGLPSKEANDRLLASLGKRQRDLRAIIQAGAGPVLGPQNQPRPTSAEVAGTKRCWFETPNQTVNLKVLPLPKVDSTPMLPPINSTKRLEMAKPRPVPP